MDLDCTAKDHHLVFWPDCQALPWDIREQMAAALSPCLTETQHTLILADCTTNAMRTNKLKLLTYLPEPLNVLRRKKRLCHTWRQVTKDMCTGRRHTFTCSLLIYSHLSALKVYLI